MSPSAVIYVRISSDPSGRQAGVERQEAECRELAARHGWEVVGVYRDNDVSAYSGKPRPAWRQLQDALKAGGVSVVIAWHTDRLYRRLRDLVPFMELAQQHNVQIATVRSGELDLGTAAGRMMASILGAVAEAESGQKSERLRAQRRQAAAEGKWNGGPRVYGYSQDMSQLVPEEAAIVREMAERLLAGDSLRALANDLNARAVPAIRGGQWRVTTIRSLITAARMSGQREHTPGGVGVERQRGRGFGTIVGSGTWPAILTPAETERLRLLLSDPTRRTTRVSSRLLTGGLAHCGRCGARLNSRTVAGQPDRWRYSCIRIPGRPSCGGLSVSGTALDDLVTEMVLGLIEDNGLPKLRAPRDAAPIREANQLQERLEQLTADYAAGVITRGEWQAARAAVDRRLAALPMTSAAAVTAPLQGLGAVEHLRTTWPTLHVDRQRAVMASLITQVVVQPARQRGRPTFDPERVEVSWRV